MSQNASRPAVPPPDVELAQVWKILRRQWWILGLCGALGLGAGYALIPTKPVVYSASSLIQVEERRSSLPSLEERSVVATGNRVDTEIEVLRSRTLAQAVVDSLDLQFRLVAPAGASREELFARLSPTPSTRSGSYHFVRQADQRFRVTSGEEAELIGVFAPGALIQLNGAAVALAPAALQHPELRLDIRSADGAVGDVLRGLRVSRLSRDADVIRLEYQDANPVLARDVANALVERFLYLRDHSQKAEARSTIAFLRQQLDTVAVQLARAEDELRGFREQAQVIDPQAEGNTQVRQLAQLQAERSGIEAERAALAQLVQQVEAAATTQAPGSLSPYRQLMAFPTLMRNQAASDVFRTLSGLDNERASLLMRRNASDPDVRVLAARIAEVEEQLRVVVNTYLAGLSTQVQSLDQIVGQYSQQLTRLPANEVQFARLSRQPRMLSEIYATLQSRLTELEIAHAAKDPSVRVVDAAILPTRPLHTSRTLFIGVAGVFGLLLGVALGFVREYRDGTVHSRIEVQSAIGVPVLGLIPHVSERRSAPWLRRRSERRHLPVALTVDGEAPALPDGRRPAANGYQLVAGGGGSPVPAVRSAGAASNLTLVTDAYDRLHTNILFSRIEREVKCIVVTSPLPGDGKTTTAVNLALTLAQRDLRVLLIDADFRRGRIAEAFEIESAPGLSEVLAGSSSLAGAIRSKGIATGGALHVLPTGALPSNPSQLLGSAQMRALIASLEQRFDRIIIDSPPLNLVPDATVLGQHGFGVIVVARAGVTPYEALAFAAEQFRHANTPVLGAVLNDIDFHRDSSYDPAYNSYRYARAYYARVEPS